MKTEEFITALRRSPGKPLVFRDNNGNAIHPGYHLTELKAARFETVDCGGQVNQWDETIIQLWVPVEARGDYMTAAKFLRIFDKVRGLVGLKIDAEIRFEYGDENFFPSIYRVMSLAEVADEIRVVLEPPTMTCKARDRRTTAFAPAIAEPCCAA